MKKIATVIAILIALGLFINLVGYIQNDHYEIECEDTYFDNGSEIAVFEIHGDLYEWEIEPNHPIHKGDMCKVSVFDFENGNKTDDMITSVKVLDRSR